MHDLRIGAALLGSLLFWLPAACDDDEGRSSSGNGTGASSSASTSSSGGGATASTGTGGSSGALGEWCEAVTGPFCEALFACCADPMVLDNWGSDVEACKTEFTTICYDDLGADVNGLIASGSSVLDMQHLAACVTKLEGLSAGGAACTEPPQIVMLTDCISAFEGQVPPGESCVSPSDDISYVECSHGLCQNGQCVALGQEGEPCLSGCDYTVGLWCSFDGMNAVCEQRGDIGDPCMPPMPSEANFQCKSLTCGTNGQCALPTPESVCASS
jgi:hypothetical protein